MAKTFIHANLVDVINQTVLRDHTLVSENGIIKELRPTAASDEGIDLNQKYVTPGIFNCHIHLWSDCRGDAASNSNSVSEHTLTAVHNLKQYIRSGVTYVRDVGTAETISVDLKRAIEKGRVKNAPDMQVCSHAICISGGTTWNFGAYQADGPEECRKAARLMLRDGADFIKLYATGGVLTHNSNPQATQLTVEEMKAAVEVAKTNGKKTCCHAQNRTGIRNTILAGVDCVEHGNDLDDELIEMMLQNGTWLDPTVSAIYNIIHKSDADFPREFLDKARAQEERSYASFKKAFDAGVPCALGSDAGSGFCYHWDTASEMVIMVDKCGIRPMDALKIGTINSAKLCGVDTVLGSLEVGKMATFAVFEKDLSSDIHAAKDCCMTVKAGEILWDKQNADRYIL